MGTSNTGSFQKGKKGGPGRPKGSLAKTTIIFKDVVSLAAQGLGGTERLMEWAKEEPQNERIFWGQIFPKLAPLTVTGNGDQPLIPPTITFVRGED